MTQKIGVILPLSFGQQPEPPPIWTECRSPVALLRPPVGWLLAARLRNRLGYSYLMLSSIASISSALTTLPSGAM